MKVADDETRVELSSTELLEAISIWLRSKGHLLVAVGAVSAGPNVTFLTNRLTPEEQTYEEETEAEVLRLLRLRKTIDAIKYHRSRTGHGLRESKDHIDRIARENGFFY